MPIIIPAPSTGNATLLDIVKRFCERTGVKVPNAVASSLDPQVRQIRSLLEEEIEELCERAVPLQAMVKEFTWSLLGAEDQGLLSTVCGEPVRALLNHILWNRTRKTPILGPVTPRQWQEYKAFQPAGAFNEYRLRGGRLLIIPAPVAGHQLNGEFVRRFNIITAGGTDPTKEFYTADTDVSVFPDQVLVAGLRWRWKREKGLTYAEDLRRYETIVGGYILKEQTNKQFKLDGTDSGSALKPAVIIPSMSSIPV